MFCDLVGFTAASESADPEDVDKMLAAYFAMARAAIEAFGGEMYASPYSTASSADAGPDAATAIGTPLSGRSNNRASGTSKLKRSP